jgi:hypothetical protein
LWKNTSPSSPPPLSFLHANQNCNQL